MSLMSSAPLELRIRDLPDGSQAAWIGSDRIPVPEGQTAQAALVQAAAAEARRRGLPYVAAVAHDTSGAPPVHLRISDVGGVGIGAGPMGPPQPPPEASSSSEEEPAPTPDVEGSTEPIVVPKSREHEETAVGLSPLGPPDGATKATADAAGHSPGSERDWWDEQPDPWAGRPPQPPQGAPRGLDQQWRDHRSGHAAAVPPSGPGRPHWGPGADDDSSFEGGSHVPDHSATGDRGPSRRGLLLGAGVGVVLLGGAAAAWALTRDDESDRPAQQPSPSASKAPGQPPAGIANRSAWELADLHDPLPTVAVASGALFALTRNRSNAGLQLVAVDERTGRPRWTSPLPADATVTDGPTLVPTPQGPRIAVGTRTHLLLWPAAGGSPTRIAAAGDSIILSSSGVAVDRKAPARGALLQGSRLLDVPLPPKDAFVIAPYAGALLVGVPGGKVYRSRPGALGAATTLAAPSGTRVGTFVAVTPRLLLNAFVPADATSSSIVRAFGLDDLKPRWQSEPIPTPVFPDTTRVSPDGAWAVAGNTWIDLSDGTSRVVTSEWRSRAIGQNAAWAQTGDDWITCTAEGRLLAAAEKVGDEVARLTPVGGSSAHTYAVRSDQEGTTLYALPPVLTGKK